MEYDGSVAGLSSLWTWQDN